MAKQDNRTVLEAQLTIAQAELEKVGESHLRQERYARYFEGRSAHFAEKARVCREAAARLLENQDKKRTRLEAKVARIQEKLG